MARLIAAVSFVALSGCVTSSTVFAGAAKVPKGPEGCRERCESWGMQLAGMVQLGEYSDGCICEVKRGASGSPSASAAIPAAAGVHMQVVADATRQQSSIDFFPPPMPPVDIFPPYIPPPPPPLP
jgi:hypothetical protein